MNKGYIEFIAGLKQNIIQSRYIAAKLANKEQLLLYLNIGKMLSEKIAAEKWEAKVLEQIAEDLQKRLPGLKGFSYTSLKNMRQFAQEYGDYPFSQPLTGQLTNAQFPPSPKTEIPAQTDQSVQAPFRQSLSAQLPPTWYGISFTHIDQAATNFWSVRILEHHINSNLCKHQGKAPNNFNNTLPENLKADALQVFRDDYLFDFITLEENGDEFFIDLLFFNRHLQCLVAFELKRGKFKPEYAGQLNFYLNVLDDRVKLAHENPSIGIILCKEKSNTIVEFAVKSIDKAMGVATYRTTKEIPQEMQGILPSPDELAKLL